MTTGTDQPIDQLFELAPAPNWHPQRRPRRRRSRDWDAVLAADPGATALQTPAYLAAVLEAGGGRDISRLYTMTDGRQLVLPLIQQLVPPGSAAGGRLPGRFRPRQSAGDRWASRQPTSPPWWRTCRACG